jgi:hypothetical protein
MDTSSIRLKNLWLNTNAPFLGFDGNVVGTHVTLAHEAVVIELPMLVTVGAIPLA